MLTMLRHIACSAQSASEKRCCAYVLLLAPGTCCKAKLCMQATPVRIVTVSSSAHQMDGLDLDDLHFKKRKYTPWKAYGQSKLCNVLYAKELATR